MCQINFYSRDCQIKFLLVMEVTLANKFFLILCNKIRRPRVIYIEGPRLWPADAIGLCAPGTLLIEHG